MSSVISVSRPSSLRAFFISTASAFIAVCALFALVLGPNALSANAAGGLSVKITSAYNLVVDSNVEAASTAAPSVATVAGKFCNDSTQVLTNVQGYIGNQVANTPGIYPARDSSQAAFITQYPHLANTGLYSFTHIGGRIGLRDATRWIGTLQPGECKMQYWHFTYPRRGNPTNLGNAVWGATNDPLDDLSLGFDIWGVGTSGVNATAHQSLTMRNEIRAMANKIKPNPDGQWFNTNSTVVKPGDIITSNGILYELGVINQGFDNDGDYVSDFNAWLQPIGDPNYDPSCFRLIRTSGVITASRGGGNPDTVIPFQDQLYFTNLPSDNNGVRGLVYYTFQALNGPCATALSPYQEVASGHDNEKFNGDYGAGIPPVASSAPEVTIDKIGAPTVVAGGNITYSIQVNNIGAVNAGLPLYSMGLVISDSIPAGTTYVAGSLTLTLSYANTGVTFLWSTDNGAIWSSTEPVPATAVTTVQAWLNDPLPPGATGALRYTTQSSGTPPPVGTPPLVINCASSSFGVAAPFAQDCATTAIQGTYSLGDWVWRDENGNGVQDDGATGIPHIGVSLYFDQNNDGKVDLADTLMLTATTSITGWYTFNNLPGNNYVVQVDKFDPDLPYGYAPTTASYYGIPALGTTTTSPYLNADFGFGPALRLTKDLVGPGPVYEGDPVTFTLRLQNTLPGNGSGIASSCVYTVWATIDHPNSSLTPPGGNGSNAQWLNTPNALKAPDDRYAATVMSDNSDLLGLSGFNLGPQAGNITNVRFVIFIQEVVNLKDTDSLIVREYYNDTYSALRTYNFGAATYFTRPVNTTYIVGQDITSNRTWTWSDFRNNVTEMQLEGNKGGGAGSSGDIGVDAAAFVITTDQLCGGSDGTIGTLPLTDTYNANQLQFVVAEPVQTALSSATTPYTNTGLAFWQNLGPLYAGQTKSVTVTFRALESDTLTETLVNTATVRGAKFLDGRNVNQATDDALTTLNRTTSIGDYVWRDLDGDGMQDTVETGLGHVAVRLTANVTLTVNGVVLAPGSTFTTTTDASGLYLFDGLRYAGNYTVTVVTATLPTATYPFTQTGDPNYPNMTCSGAQCDNRYPVAVTSVFTNITNADFGYQLPALIEGYLWHDLNRSSGSTHDANEPWLTGTVVTLTNGATILTATVDANGYYGFIGNFNGGWTVTVNTGSGPLGSGSWTQSFDTDGTGTAQISGDTISPGGYGRADFSYYQTGTLSIGDTVYTDWNGNGTQTTGETGIPNITVRLYRDLNSNGLYDLADAIVMTTTTDSAGNYLFSGLPAGNYVVTVDRSDPDFPENMTQTQDPDQAGGCTTCNDQGSAVLTTLDVSTIDFGYKPTSFGSIGDNVWKDLNGNGLPDPTEVGIPNIQVALYADLNGNGLYDAATDPIVMTTTTNVSGTYLFTGLPAGNYAVVVDSTDSDLPADSGQRYTLSTPGAVAVSLATDQTYLHADFGFSPPAKIGDTVYWDNNGNGQQDWNEVGIPGVVVSLTNVTTVTVSGVIYAPGAYTVISTTGGTGFYLFSGLDAATYQVQVLLGTGSLPANATQTGDPDVTQPCTVPSMAPYCGNQTTIPLTPGQTVLYADFGYRPLGVIGDFVFRDLDNDGLQDSGEQGLAGVVVTVTNGSTTLTTPTDFDGYYSFSNLADGTWTVTFATPANMAPTTVTSSAAATTGTGSVGAGAAVVISGGGVTSINGVNCTHCSLNIDSGFRLSGAYNLSGHVFFDSGDNGDIYSPTVDLPYSNILIYLYDQNHNLIGTTTTDATGLYTFTNLPNGSYTVSYDPSAPKLSNMKLTATPSEPGVKCSTCRNYSSITINNAYVADQDFGFYAQMDFGDLPETYGTTLATEGARHLITTTGQVYLGTAPDADGNGQPSSTAVGDGAGVNDEDGVQRDPLIKWQPNTTVPLTVTVTGSNAYLVAWFDWNLDGVFSASERVVYGNVAPGAQTINVNIPSAMPATLNARFRLYSGSPLTADARGLAINGEVEDYQWLFAPTAVTLNDLAARTESTPPVTLPIFIVMLVSAVLLITWAKRHRVA